jgi:AraC family transcriptional regulator of adaptative response / DNA-3-methyladenine glycosylase II
VSPALHLDAETCYRAVKSRDRRFDGRFWTAVVTTGIYCRPSCPARTPAFGNVRFHPSAASAQAAGYRACKRCLPDAAPGSPEWDVAADVAGRAMRLIADGVVDREGVDGLAERLGYSPRHLGRLLTAELGAGPLALARARRAHQARVLIESTGLGLADVAFAAGFSSVRQFNDTVRQVYATAPRDLRGRRDRPADPGTLPIRLAVRTPFDGRALLRFLEVHAVPGVEVVDAEGYARTLRLPHGWGVLRLRRADLTGTGVSAVGATLHLQDLRDTGTAVERARRMLDADTDPLAVSDAFAGDPVLGPLRKELPGLRVPGQVDGDEAALRTVVGQQVSVAGARTVTARLVRAHGSPVETGVPGLTHLFPDAGTLAEVDPATLPLPRSRGRALVGLAGALAAGDLRLDRGAARAEVRADLLALPGIGPWTADAVALRALGDPDVFLPTDLGVRAALSALGRDPDGAAAAAEAWRPWRSYAVLHLWTTLPLLRPQPEEA